MGLFLAVTVACLVSFSIVADDVLSQNIGFGNILSENVVGNDNNLTNDTVGNDNDRSSNTIGPGNTNTNNFIGYENRGLTAP
ncbi:MAG: hypothetical protein ACYSRP_07755 [Planctomycetota bacterium]|jgi:hypothetical protein